jgi:excinuclease ABC subunit C
VPGKEESILLDRTDAALLLLQRARDETHAASNKFQQKVASKQLRKDYLDGIPGLGGARKKLILDKLGGWKGIEQASFEQVQSVAQLPKQVRDAVWAVIEGRRGKRTAP